MRCLTRLSVARMRTVLVARRRCTSKPSSFGPATTAREALAGYDLSGTTIAVSGTSSGIGVPTAIELARAGARVLCLVRNTDKMDAVMTLSLDGDQDKSKIQSNLVPYSVNLDDLESVAACADRISQDTRTIDGLVWNAGVMFPPEYRTTKQGFEYHFGINFLSHFALTNLLTPLMNNKPTDTVSGSDGSSISMNRMIIVSAIASRWGPNLDFDDLQLKKDGAYSKMRAYGQSCTARCLFANEFDRRMSGKGWNGYSTHPGLIMTGLQAEFTMEDLVGLHLKNPDGSDPPHLKHILRSVEAGASTQVWGLTDPSLTRLTEGGGLFLQDCAVSGEWSGKPADFLGYNKEMYDEKVAKKLWEEATQLINPYIS